MKWPSDFPNKHDRYPEDTKITKQQWEDLFACMRTLASFGGTLDQAKELAQKAVKIHGEK